MTLYLPKERWAQFFNDLSKRRFGWTTKIEVMNDSIGDQILSEHLALNGITVEQNGDESTIEISVGEDTTHQSHSIVNPTKVAFLDDDENIGSIVEIEEENGTKTLVHIISPMPVIVSYSEYEIFSTAV